MTSACQAAGIESSALLGVGVGSPGVVESATGTVSTARNLPGWNGSFALGPALESALGTKVAVGNDVQVATAAEYALGESHRYDSLLGVFACLALVIATNALFVGDWLKLAVSGASSS